MSCFTSNTKRPFHGTYSNIFVINLIRITNAHPLFFQLRSYGLPRGRCYNKYAIFTKEGETMRKLLAIFMSAVLVCSMACVVSAAPENGEVQVTFSTGETATAIVGEPFEFFFQVSQLFFQIVKKYQ